MLSNTCPLNAQSSVESCTELACGMSASGTKWTFYTSQLMSAFGGKADMTMKEHHVCF